MTHKQVEAYLADEKNWHCVEQGKYLRLFILEFKGIKVAKVQTYSCINPWEANRKPLRYGWRPLTNYYYEFTDGALGFTVTDSELKRQIYDAAKEAE